jgi:hypothetical protein
LKELEPITQTIEEVENRRNEAFTELRAMVENLRMQDSTR